MRSGVRHKRSCDDHPKYRAGCAPCNRRSRYYHERRKLILARGGQLSAGSAQVVEWLRQLRAAGHTSAVIAAACGVDPPHPEYLTALAAGSREWVQLRTYFAVQDAYRQLSPFPGRSVRARNVAAKNGWTPPPPLPVPAEISESHVDDIAVERAMTGERVSLTRAEMTAAWLQLESRGENAKEIGRLLHVAERTVQRWRDEGAATSSRIKASRAS